MHASRGGGRGEGVEGGEGFAATKKLRPPSATHIIVVRTVPAWVNAGSPLHVHQNAADFGKRRAHARRTRAPRQTPYTSPN